MLLFSFLATAGALVHLGETAIALDATGGRMAIATRGGVRVVGVASGQAFWTGPVGWPVWADEEVIVLLREATASRRFVVLDLEDGAVVRTCDVGGSVEVPEGYELRAVRVWSADAGGGRVRVHVEERLEERRVAVTGSRTGTRTPSLVPDLPPAPGGGHGPGENPCGGHPGSAHL